MGQQYSLWFDVLQQNLTKENPNIENVKFKELPFCTVDGFDDPGIARMIEQDKADIIWVALGAPKQEQFMQRLQPHLKHGVQIAIGAAFNFYSGLADAPHGCANCTWNLCIAYSKNQRNR